MKDHLVILADDLSGACDTGIKFQNVGLDTRVLARLPLKGAPDTLRAGVISVNTDSRNLPATQAEALLLSLLGQFIASGDFLYYKKVDSVLRGNILPELEAMFKALSPDFALVVPAFPENGRRYRDGTLYITSGETQVETIDALSLLSKGSGRRCGVIPLEVVRKGWEAVVQEAESLHCGGSTILLADAWEDTDLRCLARVVLYLGSRCLPTGSAGMAGEMAKLMAERPGTGRRSAQPAAIPKGSTLIVVGTRHPKTVEQLQRLKQSIDLPVRLLPVKGLTSGNLADRLSQVIADDNSKPVRGLLLTTDAIWNSGKPGRSLLQNEHDPFILQALGLAASCLYEAHKPQAVIVTGGDMASEVLSRLEVDEIDLHSEFSPGVVLGSAVLGSGQSLLLAIKSGGFGDSGLLLNLFNHITLPALKEQKIS